MCANTNKYWGPYLAHVCLKCFFGGYYNFYYFLLISTPGPTPNKFTI